MMNAKLKKPAADKPVAKPVQNRAMDEPQRRDPTKRRPGVFSRAILPLAILLSAFSLPPSAFATITVTGLVSQITGSTIDTKILFTPSEDILTLTNGLSVGPARIVLSTNGAFSTPLNPGTYLVRLPLISGRNAFSIGVPHGTGNENITNLLAAPWTYQEFLNTMGTGVDSTATTNISAYQAAIATNALYAALGAAWAAADTTVSNGLVALIGSGSTADPRFSSSPGTITAGSNTLSATTLLATTVQATTLSGAGSGITALNASQLASGSVPDARSAKTQTGVTLVGDTVIAATTWGIAGDGSANLNLVVATNFYGDGGGLTGIGTNGITAGFMEFILAQSASGAGDLQSVNNLADVASTSQARTNLAAHNASNLSIGTIPQARLPGTVWTNGSLFTNYSDTVSTRTTNQVVISGAGTSAANGTYYWASGKATWTNGTAAINNASVGAYTITNATGALYGQLEGYDFPTVWEELLGSAPAPTGYIGTNTATAVGAYRATTNYFYDFPGGVSGGPLNFGVSNMLAFGAFVDESGAIYDAEQYPSAVLASLFGTVSGSFHTLASSRNVTLRGQRIFAGATAFIDAICTNADYALLGSEYGIVRNGNGVALNAASVNFGDYSSGSGYAIIGSALWTNTYMNFSSVLGGYPLTGMGASLWSMERSVAINPGGSTNWLVDSVVIGPGMQNTNLNQSTVIGQQNRTVGSTNVYLFGRGLVSTSNDVAKVGFPGSYLELQTNSAKIMSNGVVVKDLLSAIDDANLVHLTGTETITGDKTLSGNTLITRPRRLQTDLNGGTALAVGQSYYDQLSADRTITFSGTAADGDVISLTLDVSATATLTFPTSEVNGGDGATTTTAPLWAGTHTLIWLRTGDGAGGSVWIFFGPSQRNNFAATAAPTTGDDAGDGYAIGSRWINTTADTIYELVDSTAAAAVWKQTDAASSGSTYSNLTETGYTLNVRSNLTVGLNQTNSGNMYNTGTNWLVKLRVGGATEGSEEIRTVGSIRSTGGNLQGLGIIGNYVSISAINLSDGTIDSTSARFGKLVIATNGFIPQIKAGFSTNYTLAVSDAVTFCTGTNQLLTLPSAATATPGKTYTITVASTTGSVILTNATGAQTIKGTLSITIPATNMVSVITDGTHWW